MKKKERWMYQITHRPEHNKVAMNENGTVTGTTDKSCCNRRSELIAMKVSPAKENILKKIRQALSHSTPLPFPQSEGNSSVFQPATAGTGN